MINKLRIPREVFLAVILSLSLNILFLSYFLTFKGSFSNFVTGDGLGYFDLATNLVNGDGFGRFVNESYVFETFRTPGLPFILAIFLISGAGLVFYFFCISIFSGIVIPICTWYIGNKLFNKRVGIISAWIIALEPLVYLHNWLLLTEIPFLLATLIAVSLYLRAIETGNIYIFSLVGILLALAIYIRPGALIIVLFTILILLVYNFFKKFDQFLTLMVVLVVFVVMLLPWVLYIHSVTGIYAVSGTGWRNVYTDYLASLRTIKNDTSFHEEKDKLKKFAIENWGFDQNGINNPANANKLRAYALPEIYENIPLVIKLQSLLFVSYFTHTDYFTRLIRLGVIKNTHISERDSITQLILSDGFKSLPKIFLLLKNQYFIPVFERVWSMSIFILAVLGSLINYRNKFVWLIIMILAISYVSSSAIGLGVEGRLRLIILPYYLLLTSLGILGIRNILYKLLSKYHENEN